MKRADLAIRAVAVEFGVSRTLILGPERCRAIARPRHIAMWLCLDTPGLTLSAIARAFGRDRGTVRKGIARAAAAVDAHPGLARRVATARDAMVAELRLPGMYVDLFRDDSR